MKTIWKRIFSTAAAAGLVAGFATTAIATSPLSCTVANVQYDSGRLFMTCTNDPGQYYALTSNSCANQSIDTIKIWVGLAQSALLSGKTLKIAYASGGTCSVNTIQALQLWQ